MFGEKPKIPELFWGWRRNQGMRIEELHRWYLGRTRSALRAIDRYAAEKGYEPCTTHEEVIAIALYQSGSICELCREKTDLVCDHDHRTGQFRGWICDQCNRHVVDNPKQKLLSKQEWREYRQRGARKPATRPARRWGARNPLPKESPERARRREERKRKSQAKIEDQENRLRRQVETMLQAGASLDMIEGATGISRLTVIRIRDKANPVITYPPTGANAEEWHGYDLRSDAEVREESRVRKLKWRQEAQEWRALGYTWGEIEGILGACP